MYWKKKNSFFMSIGLPVDYPSDWSDQLDNRISGPIKKNQVFDLFFIIVKKKSFILNIFFLNNNLRVPDTPKLTKRRWRISFLKKFGTLVNITKHSFPFFSLGTTNRTWKLKCKLAGNGGEVFFLMHWRNVLMFL
jgi:hypothetical protein